jgi:O-antigen biosynthesis protein
MLEWTGERYLPYIDPSICGAEIHYEHLHRYAFTSQYVKGKKVLDLASGEGYGSFLLSQNAESVIGIDIDTDTVKHASKRYNKENLTFLQGSIIKIPIAGEKLFDVIVCFEAIEHIKEHELLLQEIKRLIKDDGILIISTPNKKIYSDIPNYHNPFHLKEIYYQDFYDLLRNHFSFIYPFGQRKYIGSSIFPNQFDHENNYCNEIIIEYESDHFSFKEDSAKLPRYFIAIASNKELDKNNLQKSFLTDISNTEISLLQNQISQYAQSIQALNLSLAEKDKQINDANQERLELEKVIESGNHQIVETNGFIDSLKTALHISSEGQQLEELLKKLDSLDQTLAQKDPLLHEVTSLVKLQVVSHSAKNKQLIELCEKYKTLLDSISVKDAQLLELTSQFYNLEQKLSSIENSIVWQSTMKFHHKIVERLLPQSTLRRSYYDLGLKGGRILINEGFGKLYWHFNERRRVKKNERRLKKSANARKIQYNANNCSQSTIDQIKFPKPGEAVEVSIIIPVFNKHQYTLNCLKSISDNTLGSFEVVIVDDASTDETANQLKKIPNLTIIRNNENLGFVESCNTGAKLSKGQYLLFLNNDTVVTENWLPPLLKLIKKEDVRGVGAKLIYPDGTLQEAGGIIWNDASGWNYGRGDNPEKSQYNYVRDVDYCSGAALLVKRDLFEKLDGFDRQFKPGYYEDTDLCFSIREQGYRVLYQPLSVVIHFEGISNGTDLSTGIKKYQEINRTKFFTKWEKRLTEQHFAANRDNVFDARIQRNGKKILVIDHYVPTWDRDSGSYRMYNFLKLLVELNHKVTFIGDNLLELEPYTTDIQQNGIEVIYHPTVQSVDKYLKDYGNFFDIVILSRSHIAIKHYGSVKKYCTHAKIIFDTVDLQYLRERRRAEIENDATVLKEAENSKVTELFLATHCDMTLVVSPIEKELLLQETPQSRIEVLSNIHEVTSCTTPFCDRNDLMFVGGFNHQPNVDAMKWFAKEIFPHILKSIPDIKLYIIGSDLTKEIERLASSNIIVVGYVKDLTPYFNNCRIFVSPLRYGAGVKGKINQSMSFGLPVVTTPIGAEGMNVTDGDDILIAESPEIFAETVINAYNNETLWNCLSRNSIINVEKYFSFDVTKQQLQKIIEML